MTPAPPPFGPPVSHTDEDEIGDYLGLSDSGHTFYSYIDPNSGEYTAVGLIERVARFVDTPQGEALFDTQLSEEDLTEIIQCAAQAPAFTAVDHAVIGRMLHAARRAERVTRHKLNPNCPTLGNRASLCEAGILTNLLPSV